MTILMAAVQVQPSVFDIFRNKACEQFVSIVYEFSTTMAGHKVMGDGQVAVQGDSYHMQGNGMQIYCDGSTTWLIDEAA